MLLTNTNWWPCSAHVAIALKQAGLSVAAAYPKHGHPLEKTDAVCSRFVYDPVSSLPSVKRAILESGADWILPCDDRAVLHLHDLHAAAVAQDGRDGALARTIERSLGSPEAYATVASRFELLRAAAAAGVATPATSAVTGREDLLRHLEGRQFPMVMKVDGSWGGLGVKLVHSVAEAIACHEKMRRPLGALAALKRLIVNRDAFWLRSWWKPAAPAVILQSFVQGRPANCVVFCKDGEVLASIAVEVVAAQSATGPAVKVRLVDNGPMLQAAQALAAKLRLSGMHGLDFMLEFETNAAYLIELNPRCAMPCHLRTHSGRDLIGALTAELTGGFFPPSGEALHPGDLVCYFPQAWLAHAADGALRTAYHDVPWSEPRLVKELLLLPWPDRSLLARFSDLLRGSSFRERSERVTTFPPSAVSSSSRPLRLEQEQVEQMS